MIDPILSLSFSIQSNPGVYALLVGSGVSRSAGIPTGWEVVLDLIRKLALLEGADCEPEPAAWFEKKHGKAPEYSELVNAIAKSSADRQQIHKSYFEPTNEEREEGRKLPTDAHKAIAELAFKGYIKVIITTNFDRLLEKALEETGVTPVVISTPDGVDGAIPLMHSKCTIVKVNGDYLDSRLKITENDLSKYDKRINGLLDRIFDEFGLIVCGWSAKWDIALRGALERCKNHRFTTYCSVTDKLDESAKKLTDFRRAQIISVKSADSFFNELAAKVSALEDISKPHPLSVKAAVASLKKYIPEERHKIKLHDLMLAETEKLFSELNNNNFPVRDVQFSEDELVRRMKKYEALAEIPLALIINGCYWGDEGHQKPWVQAIERIANHGMERSGLDVWLNLKSYPALLLFYGAGIASITAEKYSTFSALLLKPKIRDGKNEKSACLRLHPINVLADKGKSIPSMPKGDQPFNQYLDALLREPLREFLPDDTRYQQCFDRFEYLLALVHADLELKSGSNAWGPVGCFRWRKGIISEIETEATKTGDNWPPLKAGLFDGSFERLKKVKDAFIQQNNILSWI